MQDWLDKITIEDCYTLHTVGYEVTIEDGHITEIKQMKGSK